MCACLTELSGSRSHAPDIIIYNFDYLWPRSAFLLGKQFLKKQPSQLAHAMIRSQPMSHGEF